MLARGAPRRPKRDIVTALRIPWTTKGFNGYVPPTSLLSARLDRQLSRLARKPIAMPFHTQETKKPEKEKQAEQAFEERHAWQEP